MKSDWRAISKFCLRLLVLMHVTGTTTVVGIDLRRCVGALGVESGRIEDAQLSASSSFDRLSTGPTQARIRSESGGGAWCPAAQINATAYEWIQVDLNADYLISGVETQGRWDHGRGLEFPAGFMIEYWRDSSGRWARYKDAKTNEIVPGNVDTRTAILHSLDGGIVARLVRLIPVSETTRTVCLRLELYGCPYRDHLASYSMNDGMFYDGLDLRDSAYDGLVTNSHLSGGLGRLFDGATAADNFELRPEGWVGWRRSSSPQPNDEDEHVSLDLQLLSRQNISAVLLHVSNFRRFGAKVFRSAKIYFSTEAAPVEDSSQKSDSLEGFSPRVFEFDYAEDQNFETARWVRITIAPSRIASRLRLLLFFAYGAEWLLISEIRLEYGTISADTKWDLETAIDNDANSSIADFSIEDSATQATPIETKCFITGVFLLGGVVFCATMAAIFYYISNRNMCAENVEKSQISKFEHSKSLVNVIFENSKYSTKPAKMTSSRRDWPRIHENKMAEETRNGFKSSFDSTSTEYAEPDIESCMAQPLLKHGNAPHCYNMATSEGASCYDLMSHSVASSGAGSRYRATPSASAFESFVCKSQADCRESPSECSNQLCSLNTHCGNCCEIDNSYGDKLAAAELNRGSYGYNRSLKNSKFSTILPNFDESAVLFVKHLGLTAKGLRVELCRMDADRLVAKLTLGSDAAECRERRCEMENLARMRHFNVLHIIGMASVTSSKAESSPLSYIFEFMPNGDLRQFLLNRNASISDETLISFATQISAGMAYMESCGFVHRNLMARNCYLDTNGSVKISFEALRLHKPNDEPDFCDSHKVWSHSSNDQCNTTPNKNMPAPKEQVPIRWLAWESLSLRVFTTHSDVWMFGVTMWELFSECASRPYMDLTDERIIENAKNLALTADLTDNSIFPNALPIPRRCSQFLYDELILACWRMEPTQRPSFSELHRILQSLTFANIAPKMLNKLH